MDAREYIAKQIKHYRTKKLSLTASELARLLEPPRSSKTISSWETGRTQPDSETLLQLSRLFGISISELYPDPRIQGYQLEYPVDSGSHYVDIPLYGSIAAGKPLTAIPIEDTHPIPIELFEKYPQGFFLKVNGESMSNSLPNGSYALIDPTQTDPKDTKAYALSIGAGDTTIKRVKQLSNGYELIPDSKDPTLKPQIYDFSQDDPNEITLIGKVVWMMLPFDWEV